jgi:hypothetical protein
MQMSTKKRQGTDPRAAAVPVADTPIPEDRKMDQVRDILFGSLMRDYDRRFQEMEARLRAEIERLEGEHGRRTAAIEERLDARAEKLAAQLRQESAARAAAIEDLDHRGSQALRTQRGELVAAIEQVESDLSRSDAREREALAQLQSSLDVAMRSLREEQSTERDALRGEKLGREDLADMMAELSMRLRGTLDLPPG